jgi:hypothetical protein
MQLGRLLPLLHRNSLSTSSGQKPFDLEDEGNNFLRNGGTHLSNYTNSDSIRTQSIYTSFNNPHLTIFNYISFVHIGHCTSLSRFKCIFVCEKHLAR